MCVLNVSRRGPREYNAHTKALVASALYINYPVKQAPCVSVVYLEGVTASALRPSGRRNQAPSSVSVGQGRIFFASVHNHKLSLRSLELKCVVLPRVEERHCRKNVPYRMSLNDVPLWIAPYARGVKKAENSCDSQTGQ